MPFDLVNLTMVWWISLDFTVIIAAQWFRINVQSETQIFEPWIQNTENITNLVNYVKITLCNEP